MKKTRSLLALLLLGSMVLAGCGKDKNDSIPGGTDTPSQPSGSGDGGSGSGGSGDGGTGGEGGQQQPGGGGQQGGGGQGGEGGGGGQQGHEVTGESQWANKKFVLHHIEAETEQIAQQIQAEYTSGYAALFDDGVVEFVSVQQSYTYAYLGTFRVADDDSYAIVTLRKQYDGESEGYYWLNGAGFTTNIRQNTQTGLYVMPMQMQDHGQTINFDVHMTLSQDYPQKANIPTDPNGDSYNPQYQVYKASYDNLIIDRGLLYNYPNYTVTHTFTQNSGLGPQEVTETFKAENRKFSIQYSTNPTHEQIYERTSDELNNNNAHLYTSYRVEDSVLVSSVNNVELLVDNWDDDIGLIDIPFNSLRYDSETHAYYAAHYVCDANQPDTSAVSAIRFYFNNYKLAKITFKDYTQTQFEYNFTNYNQTTIDIPDGGGQGGGGGGQQQNDEPTDYYQYVQNKTLSYNRVSNTGELSSEELQNAAAANANIAVGVFNDLSIEMQWPDHFYYDGENCSMSVLMYGSLQFSSFGTLSGRRVARGSVTITGLFINGADESGSPHEMPAMWDIQNNQLVIKMDDPSNGDQYYLFLDVSNTAPTHIPQPEAPQSQLASFKLLGVNNDWTVGISGTDATNQSEIAHGDYVEQRKFDFTAQANEEIKVNSGDTWVGYDSLEPGCQALATRVNGGLEDNNIKLNEGGNYSLYLKLLNDSSLKIWLSKESGGVPQPEETLAYTAAKASFEAALLGGGVTITVPSIYNLDASFMSYDDPSISYAFITATSSEINAELFASFITHFTSELSSWTGTSHDPHAEAGFTVYYYDFENNEDDNFSIYFYSYTNTSENYLVLFYMPHVASPNPSNYPAQDIADFLSKIGASEAFPELGLENVEYEGIDNDEYYSLTITPTGSNTLSNIIDELDDIFAVTANYFNYNLDDIEYYSPVGANPGYSVFYRESGDTVDLEINNFAFSQEYPELKVNSYLNGLTITDTLLSTCFDDAGNVYAFYPEYPGNLFSELVIYNKSCSASDFEDVGKSLLNSLIEDGFREMTESGTGECTYLAPSKDYGVVVQTYEGYMSIYLYNMTSILNPEYTFSYSFIADDDWYNNNEPRFFAWVYGGIYGEGMWFEVDHWSLSKTLHIDDIDSSATGLTLCRFNKDGTLPTAGDTEWDGAALNSSIYNQVDMLFENLPGNESHFHF